MKSLARAIRPNVLTRQRRDNANFAVEKPQVQEPHTTVHQTSRDGPYVQNQADKIDWVLGALHMMLLLAGVKPAPWPLAPKVDELCNPELNRGMLHRLIEKITRRKANTHTEMCPAKPALGFCRTLMSLALGVHSYQFRREETVFCHLQLGSSIQVWAESYVLTCLQGSFRLPKPAGLALPGKACGRSLGSMLSCVRSSEPTLGCCHHISAPQCPKWSALSSSADWSQGSGSLLLRLRTWT